MAAADLLPLYESIANVARRALVLEFDQQGHRLSGRLQKSIRYEISKTDLSGIIDVYMLDYGLVQDAGIRADRIPVNFGSGAKTSQYIQGLIDFAIKRFRVGSDEAVNVAFAIARKHKQTGMPTPNAFQFSKNGRRTGFIKAALEQVKTEIIALANVFIKDFFVILMRDFNNRIKTDIA